jgi:hypothetical protein
MLLNDAPGGHPNVYNQTKDGQVDYGAGDE